MKVQIGSVVTATAGRDCGGYFVVTDTQNDGFCMIADGKSRKLNSPKRKNCKHISVTNSVIDLNDITDKKLRKLMKELSAAE